MVGNLEAALGRDRAYMQWLARRVCEVGMPARRAQFFVELAAALQSRIRVMEDVVFPALRRHAAHAAVDSAEREHREVERKLSGIHSECDSHLLCRRVAVFLGELTGHLERASEVLTVAARALPADEAEALGEQLRARWRAGGEGLPPAPAVPPALRKCMTTYKGLCIPLEVGSGPNGNCPA